MASNQSALEELKELNALMKAELAATKEQLHEEKQGRQAAEERARIATESPEKAMILNKIEALRTEEKEKGKDIYYENQEVTADQIVEAIDFDDIIFQMVCGVCQSGKTGCMLATIEKLLQPNNRVKPENIFVVTGLSDVEWVAQTKKRLPINDANVIHRGQFNKSTVRFKDLENAVLIIDECQIACKEEMGLDKLLERVGLKDLAYLKENNVNIVEFSATPNSTLNDIEHWDTYTKKHFMKPGEGYKGHSWLITNQRLRQAKDLFISNDPPAGLTCDYEHHHNDAIKPATNAIKDVKHVIETSYTVPRFHIIRTPAASKAETVIGRFQMIFGDQYVFKKCFNGEVQLMDELAKTPTKHTFLFIKEKARCAITFDRKDLIGVLYERLPKNPKDDVIVQGLSGRACGYNVDDDTIVFTNIDSIKRYVAMVESDFKERSGFTYTGYKSKKKTHLHPTAYGAASIEEKTQEPIIKMCRTIPEARQYIKETPILNKKDGTTGPSAKAWERKKTNGFYPSTSGKGADKERVRSTIEIRAIRNWSLNKTHPYTFHPCYRDVKDASTLEWCVIHR